jgi:hypothetical protein
MRKSKQIQLVLITSLLATCGKKAETDWGEGSNTKKVYMRSDTSAQYTQAHYGHGGSALMWYFAFRSFGMMNGGNYSRGYHSSAISPVSNYGGNVGKRGAISRGGFGRSARAGS